MSIDREKLNKVLQVNYAGGVTPQTSKEGSELRKNLKKRKKKKKDEEDDPITPLSEIIGSY